jgi:hypothetical protein
MKQITKTVCTLIVIVLFFSCSNKYSTVPEDKFIGIWELKGRSMFDSIQIKIDRENKELVGRVYKINSNKYVKLFVDSNAVWTSEIKRSSNFEFDIKENKIAKELFGAYGQSTSQEFKVQFIDDNTIGLATGSSDPLKSIVQYKRIN